MSTYKTTSQHLSAMVAALQKDPPARPIPQAVWAQLETFTSEGWILRYAIEDLLMAMDSRLDSYDAGNVGAVLKMFELSTQSVARRPRKLSTGVVLDVALPIADFAQLLIHLEQLGFRVDPDPLIRLLLPMVAQKAILTQSELSIFWYERQRHRGEPLTIALDSKKYVPFGETLEWKLNNGYRLEARINEDKSIDWLTAHAPKYRRRPAPVRTVCPECGVEYYRGDTDSSAAHRREHRIKMRYFDPQPHPKLLETADKHSSVTLVNTFSPPWMHLEMYERALAFKREFKYDFTQWGSRKGDNDPDVHGYLFANEGGAIVGACSFRLRQHDNESWWALQWVWLSPRHRREGHLSRHWRALREKHGDFFVEPPVSEAMQAFLERQGDGSLMDFGHVTKIPSSITS
jgi:hypothetical protein